MLVLEDYPVMSRSFKDAYMVISNGLLDGFKALDIHASLSIPEEKFQMTDSTICFEEPSWYELIFRGKKAAGSGIFNFDCHQCSICLVAVIIGQLVMSMVIEHYGWLGNKKKMVKKRESFSEGETEFF